MRKNLGMIQSDTPVVVGAFVTIIAGFLAVAKIMLNQATKDREADRDERLKLSMAIEHMANSSAKVAEATLKSAVEAKQRNGHLGDLVAQGNEMTTNIFERLEKTATIAAEDRDVLTNQNVHIRTEVKKIMKENV